MFVCESMAWQGPDAKCGVQHATREAADNHAHRLNGQYRDAARYTQGMQNIITEIWRVSS